METSFRPSSTMASRKAAAMEFIRRHFAQRGASPSFGEIAAALGTDTGRVKAIVRQLTRDGSILRTTGGRRAIALPDPVEQISQGELMRRLAAQGYRFPPGGHELQTPVTNTILPLPPDLDHIPGVAIAGDADDEGGDPG